jgi:hypothetical protein
MVSLANMPSTSVKIQRRLRGARRHFWKSMTRRPFSIPFEVAFKIRQNQDRALPDALVIGGQKCGSTSIYRYLVQHPQIRGVVQRPDHHSRTWVDKEIHFFDIDDRYRHGERWYRAHFQPRREGVINVEATPNSLTHLKVPNRARALVPNAKPIVSLRDPVERAFSAFQHMQRASRNKASLPRESFREYINRKIDPKLEGQRRPGDWEVLDMGKYVIGLERWLACYPREQFHIIDFRELVSNPDETVAGIIEFLGLPPLPINTDRSFNQGHYVERMDPDLEERLREYFEPHNRRLEALLGYSMGW